MTLSPLQRYYLLQALPPSGSLEESIILADLRPKLAWSEEEADVLFQDDQETVNTAVMQERLDPIDVDITEKERRVIAQGLVLMEAKHGKGRDLPSDQEFAGLVREFRDEIRSIRKG